MIGPNGAGKTSVFNLISRIYDATTGEHPVRRTADQPPGAAPHRRARHCAHVPEHRAVRDTPGAAEPADRPPRAPQQQLRVPTCSSRRRRGAPSASARAQAETRDRAARPAASPRLAGGTACPMACARWWSWRARCAPSPKLLLLDEPSSGLNVEETEDMACWIRDIRKRAGHHGADGRARHEPGVARLRPRAGDEPGRGAGAGHAGRGAGASRRDRGVSRVGRRPVELAQESSVSARRRATCLCWPTSRARTARSARCAASACTVRRGEIVTVLGSNGAGKSTILKTISGVLAPDAWQRALQGRRHHRARPGRTSCAAACARARGPRGVPLLSVHDNLVMGGYTRGDRDARDAATWRWCTATSRSCKSATARTPGCCRAASSRCWRSAAR